MKVRVKKTGEVLNVADYAKVATEGHDSWGNPLEYGLDEIEIIPDEPQAAETPAVDWGQRRYEIARDCLASLLPHRSAMQKEELVNIALGYANILIDKLNPNRQ